MGNEVVGLVATLLLLQFASSILHPSFLTVSKCALSMLALLTAFGIILSAIDKYELPDFAYDSADSDEYYEALSDAMELGIALEVAERYGISEEKISVSISELDLTRMRAKHIYVRIEDIRVDYRSVRVFLKDNFLIEGGSVEVELTEQ